MQIYNIFRGVNWHNGKTIEQTDTFCQNTKAILEKYVSNKKWNVDIQISYNHVNISCGVTEKEIQKKLQELEEHIKQNEEAYNTILIVDDVLSSFE